MSWSKSRAQYTDIITHLTALTQTNARQFVFKTPAEAQRWRARVYMYRTILREEGGGTSPYDRWILRITKDDPCVVQILEEYTSNIEYRTAEGGPVSRVEAKPDYDDPAAIEKAKAVFKGLAPSGMDTANPFGWNKKPVNHD